jgi:Xaa-Pro aminopeptidase
MTPLRYSIALLALVALLSTRAPAQQAGVASSEYQARRATFAKTIGPDAFFVAFSSDTPRRTGDVDWPFRQEDNLLYLTGMNEPDTTLVMLPGERERSEMVFSRDRDPANERWTGIIPSREQVTAATGVKDVSSSRRFNGFVDALFQGRGFGEPGQRSYYATPVMPAFLSAFRTGRAEVWLVMHDTNTLGGAPTREQKFADDLRRQYPSVRFRDASPVLLAMREIKSPTELTLIQRAIDITAAAQKAAMTRVLTATREYEVQATIEFTFRNLGACCWAFPSIVASGRNSTTLHYESNNEPIVRNGLLLTDIGAEVDGYSADVTRTYPASGRFSAEQRALYDAVLAAQNESLVLMRPGHQHVEVNDKAIEVVGRELLKLGLVTKNTAEQAGLYLFHGTGHPLGLQTHDVYDRMRTYEPGMVFTNEPGIYVRKDDILAGEVFAKLTSSEQQSMRTALERYDGIGIRIEDDVLVTAGDPKLLSGAAPRMAADIEAWMAASKK